MRYHATVTGPEGVSAGGQISTDRKNKGHRHLRSVSDTTPNEFSLRSFVTREIFNDLLLKITITIITLPYPIY